MRRINQWFGGTATTTDLVRRVTRIAALKRLSLLEIGAGLGDVPLGARRALARDGIELQVTLLDRLWTHLPSNGAATVSSDALRLPFCEGTFDIISCSLFAHHLPNELRLLVEEALRVSRRAVLINDLIRSRVHLALTYAGLPLFRSRITWHDAPASVRAAYTREEMQSLLAPIRTERLEITRHYLYRMGILVWK